MFDTGALEQYARNLNLPRGAPWSRRMSYVSGRERRAPATHLRVTQAVIVYYVSFLLVAILDVRFPAATYRLAS